MVTTNIYESRQGEYRAGTISMTVLGVVFVVLRFLARWKKGLSVGADDYVILLSLLFLFATCALNLAMIHYGMGRHADVLPAENIVIIAKLLMCFECVYCTTVGIVKISILLMYARIFPTRGFRIASIILSSIVVGWVIAIICVSVFQCNPIAKAWNFALPGACINLKGSFIGNAVPNILTDIAILALPVHVVWGLHATVTHRLSVIAIFLLGSFVIFTSAYRFSTLFEFEPADTPWTLAKACTWCLIECSSGIISACMPTLRPLFVMLSSKFGSSTGTRTRTTGVQGSGLKSYDVSGSALRPPGEFMGRQKVQLEVSQRDDASGDEVPLNTIRVQHDMTWQETNYGSSQPWN
ncbi:putative integral membrane protein [Penicillium brasilianum]|uniref:Putative integral membrane protein n=1 Tax=Penicillium brasilianum TaxID=104259 RepID=A0A1S9R8B0_PENBI|nr:putative integral membrane protein [Penicillium brasilianum]